MRCYVTVTPDDIKPESKWALEQGLDTIGVVERYDWPTGSKFADTPYELWTPSYRTGQPVPRFATLNEAVAAADEIAEERASTSILTPVEVHRETYRGTEFVVTRRPATVSKSPSGRITSRTFAQHGLEYGGRQVECPKGDIETAVKKIRGLIDKSHLDRALLPKVVALIDARQSVEGMAGFDGAPDMGDVAYVYAMGRYRRGLVTKVTRTRATVSYTTASSNGRIFHKADKHDELAAGA
ncbi:hypothetical protein F3K32_42680 [Streptomyces sp. LBUM 1483]|uniref:hypothetical protein n=1 Tax=Streptomyces scabiei TaxID=1930 RepID=UPI001B318DDA|nr:hypothetical protein [Streptomyces sp. LBUM 1483]MBP5926715.1 hypothetical protein [Streptomyces sp. LBUM 1483]